METTTIPASMQQILADQDSILAHAVGTESVKSFQPLIGDDLQAIQEQFIALQMEIKRLATEKSEVVKDYNGQIKEVSLKASALMEQLGQGGTIVEVTGHKILDNESKMVFIVTDSGRILEQRGMTATERQEARQQRIPAHSRTLN